jgi:hypothetical protein
MKEIENDLINPLNKNLTLTFVYTFLICLVHSVIYEISQRTIMKVAKAQMA